MGLDSQVKPFRLMLLKLRSEHGTGASHRIVEGRVPGRGMYLCWARVRKGVFEDRGCVVGAWCMGWLGEDKVSDNARIIMKSLGGHDKGYFRCFRRWVEVDQEHFLVIQPLCDMRHAKRCRSQGQGHEACLLEPWPGQSSLFLPSSVQFFWQTDSGTGHTPSIQHFISH